MFVCGAFNRHGFHDRSHSFPQQNGASHMQALRNFLDHGILPFVGRREEIGRLLRFWEETAEARALRIALLAGEAGVGKSRLVQELTPLIEERGGVVAHVRLYPGAMTSLVPLVDRAIAAASTGRMLKGREGEGMHSVIEGLQRLARLRPLLLVIEDIHLLAEESLAEFTHLLDAVGNESLSVLCLTRPVELAARKALDRYLVEDIAMAGLAIDDQRDLWEALFSAPPDPAAMKAIQEIALGNPLALRSAFRGVLKSGQLLPDERKGRWEMATTAEMLAMVVDRNVGMMAGGLMLHLTPAEHDAAMSLARLGEVFSREAAETILPDAPALVEALLRKGILATSSVPITALSGPPSFRPLLALTHTVLHGHLARHAEAGATPLVEAIAAGLPLYSILPFQLVAKSPFPLHVAATTAERAILRTLDVAHALDSGPDWEGAVSVWEAAQKIFRDAAGMLSSEDEAWLHAEIINRRITLLRRAIYSDTFASWTGRYLDLTESPATCRMAEYRLRALRFFYEQEMRRGARDADEIPREVEKLLNDFPALRASTCYLEYLESRATIAWTMHLPGVMEQVEEWLAPILADEGTPEEHRQFIRRALMPFFLLRFSTPEELRRRLDLLADLDTTENPRDLVFLSQKLELLWMIGSFAELLAVLEGALPRLRQRGLLRLFNRYSVMETMARTAFGATPDEVEEGITRLREEMLPEISKPFQGYLGTCIFTFGALLGETRWSRAMLDAFTGGEEALSLRSALLLRAVEGVPEALLSLLDEAPLPDHLLPLASPLRGLAMLALGESADHAATARMVEEHLAGPILRLADVVEIHGILSMIEKGIEGQGDEEIAATLGATAGKTLRSTMRWLADRALVSYLAPLLECFGHRLGCEEAEAWREEIGALERGGEGRVQTQDQLEISMLGTITIHRPGEEPHRMRGARLCALLGAIVGAAMLRKPLSHRDFCRLVSGENDPEYARKMMNGAVWRLRDLLGQDAVLTDLELPRLNPELVRVDLLAAHCSLNCALQAEREGSLMRAVPSLLTALAITGGEVPFPGLYDPFFEAAREDFENLLRGAIIRIGTGLLDAGDPARAEDMLHRAVDLLGDDEEIAALLGRALVALGRRAEASLVLERSQARK
jgi:DNA-binding SARP family transcriptional activator